MKFLCVCVHDAVATRGRYLPCARLDDLVSYTIVCHLRSGVTRVAIKEYCTELYEILI